MEFLDKFCECSGQKINVEKSSFMMYSKTPSPLINSIVRITGYQRKANHMTYLGAPICDGRIRVSYFDDLLTKIRDKMAGWKANFLTHGGKLIMIRHVLSSMSVYLLSTVAVPKRVLAMVNRMIATFFWGSSEERAKRNWVAWANLCTPLPEGGLGVRNLEEVLQLGVLYPG
ncbi:hypothetical protein BVC80_669g5 [Macleaya cordata]|uniref:Reverse transcriptase domain n=1 Tax=Macleaya cordata TaxID=56857 RepID=A0A200QAT6_MACCD|nr:hypothetical protein BVC80_669g5 [Macleaya cordata]